MIAPGNHFIFIRCAEHYPYWRDSFSSTQVVFAASTERHTGRSLRFRWTVLPFIRTGCIRDVAAASSRPYGRTGGRFRFVRTGCIRGVSGTAHRPFPTVSLEGLLFLSTYSKNVRFLFPWDSFDNVGCTNNCQLSTANSPPNCPLSIVNLRKNACHKCDRHDFSCITPAR